VLDELDGAHLAVAYRSGLFHRGEVV
jgi:hypothetical protein